MTLQTGLDALRDTLPACKSAAFGDLSAALILRSSTTGSCSRDVLDGMCQKAKSVFDATGHVQSVDGVDATVFARSAVLFDADSAQLFARHDASSEDVILVEIGGGQPIADAVSRMMGLASEFAETAQ